MLPKYIENKIEQLNEMLGKAYLLKNEIERWAETKGIDTSSHEWYENVIDECSGVNGIFKEELKNLLKDC